MIWLLLHTVSGPPVCPQRWSFKSLSSISISWQPPTQPNGIITGYSLELVSFDNQAVLQSADVSNALSYNFTGFTLGKKKYGDILCVNQCIST